MEYDMKLSVLVVTYNHEMYIKKAIDSILMQKFEEDFEIVIADDCSTDNTLKIIKEYECDKIRILKTEKNLGITKNYQRAFKACKGKYIAVLEGDDYWTSPYKLQKQVQFLEDHRECVSVFNRFDVFDMHNMRHKLQPQASKQAYELINIDMLLKDNMIGNFSTCMYRAEEIEKINPALYDMMVYDWMFNLVLAQNGLIGYLPEIMSVYRLHPSGTWTQKSEIEKIDTTIKCVEQYDKYFNYLYKKEFAEFKKRMTNRKIMLSVGGASGGKKLITRERVKKLIPPIIVKFFKLILPPVLFKCNRGK